MLKPLQKPLFYSVVLICILCPSLAALAASEESSPETVALQGRFLELKATFEKDAKRVTEQKILTTMALETTAQSWGLAAEFSKVHSAALAKKKEALAKAMNSRNWEQRELAALEYYYEAIFALTKKISQQNTQAPLVTELESIAAKTAEQLQGVEAKPDGILEKRVVLSGALSGIMAVAIKSVGGGAMEKPIQLIVKTMRTRAHSISDRPDIHYRAKLSLLYANNIEGLTALIFLLGHNAGPPLSTELAKVHSAWDDHVENANLPDTLSLTATAQCQAVLPLAFWLATH